MSVSVENGYLDVHFDRGPADTASAQALGLVYARHDGSSNYNLSIVYDGWYKTYYLQIRHGLFGLVELADIPAAAGDYFRFEVVRQHLVAYQSTDQETWVETLATQDIEHMVPGDWYVHDWASGPYQPSNIAEVGRDLETFFLVGSHQIYDRPKTIAGQRVQRIEGKLYSYNPKVASETIFEGEIRLSDTAEQSVRITHDPADSGTLTIVSGGTLVGTPAYYTYSTLFTVNPSSQTVKVKLEGSPVTIGERDNHSTYGGNGDVVTLECPIASNPTLANAMHDHYAAVAGATRYEFAMRDDASLEVGDEVRLPLISEREYGHWNYKLPTNPLGDMVDTPLWSITVTNVVPVVLTKITRSFNGATDATCLAITNINP